MVEVIGLVTLSLLVLVLAASMGSESDAGKRRTAVLPGHGV